MSAIGSNKPQQRMVWLDCLRLMAGVSMVGLHASSDINGQPFPDFAEAERVLPVLFRSVVYLARTELFLIISLFLLCLSLEKRPRGYRETVLEQARRLLVPFAFWVLFYAFYRLIKSTHFGYDHAIWDQLTDPFKWPEYFLLGSVQYHMHFLPTLFGLVLLYPLYRAAMHNPLFGLIILVCLFAKREMDIWLWGNLRDFWGFDYVLRGIKILTYAGYGIVAASFAGLVQRNLTAQQLRGIAATSLYLLVIFYGIKLIYSAKVVEAGNWQYNYTPAYWADFLIPAFLFGLCFALKDKNWPEIFSTLAPYSFGIYLVHPIFLDLLEIAFWDAGLSPIEFVLIKFGAATLLSTALVILLRKSGFLGWTVGLGPLPFSLGRTRKQQATS